MAGPIKDFSALKSLRKEIKAQDEARQAAAAEAKLLLAVDAVQRLEQFGLTQPARR